MKISIRPHLKIRLKERNIPTRYPRMILLKPNNKYFDPITNHHIAVKELEYNGKMRPMVLAYDIIGSIIQVITIYPTTEKEIANRIKSKRWIKK